MPGNETDPYIPAVDTDIEDEEETPRASVQVSQLRESKEKLFVHRPVEDLQPAAYHLRKSSLTSHTRRRSFLRSAMKVPNSIRLLM